MADYLNNVTLHDQYQPDTTLGPANFYDHANIAISGNSALAQFAKKQTPGGAAIWDDSHEDLIIAGGSSTQSFVARDIQGLRLRNAVAGKNAQAVVRLAGKHDVKFEGASIFPGAFGPAGALGQVGVLDRVIADVDVSATANETPVYTFNFLANQIPPNGIVELRVGGDLLHNNVAGDVLTLRVKFGGVLVWGENYNAGGYVQLGATRHPWSIYLRLQNRGDAAKQQVIGDLAVEQPNANVASVLAGLGTAGMVASIGEGPIEAGTAPLTVDTTLAQALQLTAQWSAASGSNSFAMRSGYLVLQ